MVLGGDAMRKAKHSFINYFISSLVILISSIISSIINMFTPRNSYIVRVIVKQDDIQMSTILI